jgi:hypothetical protein
VTDIEELFEQAVAQMPPSRLSAAQVYASGRARRRRRRGAAAGSAVSAGVAVLLVGIAAVTGGTPTVTSTPSGVVMWAGAADNSNLYLVTDKCAEPENEPSPLPSGYTIHNGFIRDPVTSSPTLQSLESPAADSSYPPMLAPSPVQRCDELFASRDGGRSWRSQGLLPGPLRHGSRWTGLGQRRQRGALVGGTQKRPTP